MEFWFSLALSDGLGDLTKPASFDSGGFALDSVVVVSGASQFEDFLEASAAAQNHSALSRGFHTFTLNLRQNKFFRNSVLPLEILQKNYLKANLSLR